MLVAGGHRRACVEVYDSFCNLPFRIYLTTILLISHSLIHTLPSPYHLLLAVSALPWTSSNRFSAQFLPRSPAFHWPTHLGHQQIASWSCPFSLAFDSENRNSACYTLSFNSYRPSQLYRGDTLFFSRSMTILGARYTPCSTLHYAGLENP